jgi:hypothetical protein
MDIDNPEKELCTGKNRTGGIIGVWKLFHATALLPSTSPSHFHTTSFSWVDRVL